MRTAIPEEETVKEIFWNNDQRGRSSRKNRRYGKYNMGNMGSKEKDEKNLREIVSKK